MGHAGADFVILRALHFRQACCWHVRMLVKVPSHPKISGVSKAGCNSDGWRRFCRLEAVLQVGGAFARTGRAATSFEFALLEPSSPSHQPKNLQLRQQHKDPRTPPNTKVKYAPDLRDSSDHTKSRSSRRFEAAMLLAST